MARLIPDPFETLFNLQRALDASRASDWLARGPSARGAYPPLNIFRKGDDLVTLLGAIGAVAAVQNRWEPRRLKPHGYDQPGIVQTGWPEQAESPGHRDAIS